MVGVSVLSALPSLDGPLPDGDGPLPHGIGPRLVSGPLLPLGANKSI